ncbi:unnamed protein product [Xylocopa violacea]|uniref:Uncharacterized protein n=1 Tax=Xylocopa violacea TaxID=135666 RepID=A0ABP1NFG9_XYLVO
MQRLTMHKSDSADFTRRVKLLLELMTKNSAEESISTEEDDYLISTDESDIETDDNEDYSDSGEDEQNFENGQNYDTVFRLNKFFHDHVDNTRKHLSSSTRNSVWNDFKFEEKMYRVIPLRLNEETFK